MLVIALASFRRKGLQARPALQSQGETRDRRLATQPVIASAAKQSPGNAGGRKPQYGGALAHCNWINIHCQDRSPDCRLATTASSARRLRSARASERFVLPRAALPPS